MASTPRSQMTLAQDANFLKRLTALFLAEAQDVANEPAPPADPPEAFAAYTKRRNLANQIINNPTNMSAQLAPTITNAPTLLAATTSYNFEVGATDTDASDTTIRSEIATLWNVLAGV